MTKFIDYDEKSDYEINLMFLKSLARQKGWPESSIVGYPHDGDKRSVGVVGVIGEILWFDFCNCAADSFPRITEAGVTLIRLEDYRWMAITCNNGPKVPSYHAYHDNVLRAAITALIKQEVDQ